MRATELPAKIICRSCGYEHTDASAVHGQATPRAGDISVCIGCGAIAQFSENLSELIPATADFLADLAPENRLQVVLARQAVLHVRARANKLQ